MPTHVPSKKTFFSMLTSMLQALYPIPHPDLPPSRDLLSLYPTTHTQTKVPSKSLSRGGRILELVGPH